MKNEEFPFLLIDQNKNNQDEEESDFSEEKRKRSKKFELQKFEKFKPKNSNISDNDQMNLAGAESQLKSMLSLFLKDIEQENKKTDILNNNNFNINQKDNNLNKFKRKDIKRNSIAYSNFNFGKIINNDLKFDTNKKLLNKVSIKNHNKINKKDKNFNSALFFPINNQKKEGINISLINNRSNKNINQNTFSPKNSKNFQKSLSLNTSNNGSISPNKKNNIIQKSTHGSNIWDQLSPGKKSKNKNISSINSLSIDNKISPKKNKISKGSSLNDSNINLLLSIDYSQKSSDKNVKRAQSNILQKANSRNISSFAGGINHIKNNIIKHRNSKHSDKIEKNNLNENLNINDYKNHFNGKLKNQKNNNNTILSEESEWNLNQESKEEINKKESNNTKNNIYHFSSLKSLFETKNIEHKNSEINSIKINKKMSNELNLINRRGTNFSEEKKININNKIFRHNKKLKSFKKILQNSIIIRPEELKLHLKTSNKKNKYSSSSSLGIKNKRQKRKNRSGINLLKINNKNMSFENLNKSDIAKKNKSSTSNIKIIIPKEKKEKKNKISDKKLNSQKELKPEDKSVEKIPSLKRRNAIFIPKCRALRRIANIYDSLDDEEFEDAEEINHLYIHPNSNYIFYFDAILAFSSFLSFIIVPLYLAKTHNFCRKGQFDIIFSINIIIECMSILDLLLSFFRGYYNWEEQLIYRKRKIMVHYFGGWFLFDFISAIPVFIINKMNEPYCNNYELNTIHYNQILDNPHYLFLCNRLFKLYKIFNNNQAYKFLSNKVNENLGIIISIVFVFLALNYLGCLYIFIARNCYPNWILITHLDTSSFLNIYICSIYILIMAMTTVGYGDITCYSFWERIFQLFILIVGISAYSWSVTSFSNYIKKINERSADFERKKQILDEIKINHQNLPDELYDKILRFLKFKNYHEKKLKNIIFDCLPISLKNNLICEMYKPIIKNFIFFKNFQNTDFIVRVILAFRPIIADRNDILINNDDMVEDIMFVKHGVLSVELPINISNPQKNIDKYLNMSVLKEAKNSDNGNVGNTTILYTKLNDKLNNNIKNTNFKTTIRNFSDSNKNNNDFLGTKIGLNSALFSSENGTDISLRKKFTFSDKEKDEIRYVKILCIRENEHFGDVMMFLEKRSPLRVRVKSKKVELFFLKKMDAINISISYPNIWRRINKKSVFNFEQIKKSINKIVDIYSSIKRINSFGEESSNTSIYSELIKKGKIGKKESVIDLRPKKYELNESKDVVEENDNLKRSKSHKSNSNKFLKNILKKNKIEKNSSKNITKKRSSFSSKKQKKEYSINEIINNNNKKVKFDNKLDDVYKEHYKFYKKINQSRNKRDSIINEEPSKEDIASRFKSTKSFKKVEKITISPKSNKYNKKDSIKIFNFENDNIDNNSNHKIKNKNSHINLNNMNILFKKSVKTLKLDDSSSLNLINDENFDIVERIEDNNSNNFSYDKNINNEINLGEEIIINKGDNLFTRKINSLYPIKSNSYINKNAKNDNMEFRNSKVELLLNSLYSKESDNNIINDNKNIISENSSESIDNSKSNELNKDLIYHKKDKDKKINRWGKNSLKIFSNISFKYDSSYENCNLICGQKLIKNKINQHRLKTFLIDEILKKNVSSRNSSFQLSHKEIINININTQINQKDIDKDKKELKTFINTKTSSFLNKQIKNKFKKCSTLMEDSTMMATKSKPSTITRTASFNGNNRQKNSLIKNNFQFDVNDLNKNITFSQRRSVSNRRQLFSCKTTSKYMGLNFSNEKNKRTPNRRASFKMLNNRIKRKKGDLLSKINFNIQKTNQNLNNPEEFYSNYFHSILEEKAGGTNNIMYKMSMKALPKLKKDKNLLKRNFSVIK